MRYVDMERGGIVRVGKDSIVWMDGRSKKLEFLFISFFPFSFDVGVVWVVVITIIFGRTTGEQTFRICISGMSLIQH